MKELDLARGFCYDYLNNLLDTHVLAGLLEHELSDITKEYLLDHLGFIPEGMFIVEKKTYTHGTPTTQIGLKPPLLHKDGDRIFNADSVFLPILRLEGQKLSYVLSCGDKNLYVETFNKKLEIVCLVSRTYNKQKTNRASIKIEDSGFFGAREKRDLKAIFGMKDMSENTVKSLAQLDICGFLRDLFVKTALETVNQITRRHDEP